MSTAMGVVHVLAWGQDAIRWGTARRGRQVMAQHWVGTWTVAPAPAERMAFINIRLRMNGRVSLGGKILRVRLSNAFGIRPLTIGAAHIGRRAGGPAIMPGSDR